MKLYGRVLKLDGRFHPTIETGDGDVLWRGVEHYDVWPARWSLAEAVALVGLCFWPPSYVNDNGRELGVSPWTVRGAGYSFDEIAAAASLPVVCGRCGNEIDPDCCWCGSPIPHDAYHEGHDAVPMGCDCGRAASA